MLGSKPKPATPDAQRVVDALNARKAEAERVAASAQERISALYIRLELPGSNAPPLDESEIAAAKAERDRARETIERVSAALAVANERLAAAVANDSENALIESWQRQSADSEALRAMGRQIIADSRALGARYADYLTRRDALIDACPDLPPRISGIANDAKIEGRQRMAHVLDATASAFHRRYPGLATFEPTPEVEMAREDEFLSLLGSRALPVAAPPPPPPKPPEAAWPMRRVGKVA